MKQKSFAPVRAQLSSDHKVNLNVNIIGIGKLIPSSKCGPRKKGQDNVAMPSIPGWTKGQLQQLLSMEKEVMGWIKKNKKNQSMFFENPIRAIEKSGIKLDRSFKKKLSRAKLTGEKNIRLQKGLSLGNIKISATKHIVPPISDKDDKNSQNKHKS